jgi:hypothetical protein
LCDELRRPERLRGGIATEETIHEPHDQGIQTHGLATRDVQRGAGDLARALGHQAADVGPLGHGLDVDAVDEPIDIDTVQQAVDIDTVEQSVDVDAVEEAIHVDAIEKLIDVDTSKQIIELDLSDEGVHIYSFEHGVDEPCSTFVLTGLGHDVSSKNTFGSSP